MLPFVCTSHVRLRRLCLFVSFGAMPPPPFPSLCPPPPPPPPPHSSRWAASFVHSLSNKRREGDASSGPALTGHRAVRHPFAGLSKGGMRAPIPWDRRLAPLQRRRPLPTATYRFITARFGLQLLFAPAQPVALGLSPPPPRVLAGARATRADCLFSDGRFGGQGTQECDAEGFGRCNGAQPPTAGKY